MQVKNRTAVCFVMLAILLSVSTAWAKSAKVTPPAPVPSQITSAKKIFIANLGQDDYGTVADGELLSGSSNRSYDEFYAAMKSWNQYEIVSTPDSADLIFEISWTFVDVEQPLDSATAKPPTDLGHLKLTIVDRTSRVTLWGFQEHVRDALLQSNRDKNFEQSMTDIVNDVKALAGQGTNAPAGTNANQ